MSSVESLLKDFIESRIFFKERSNHTETKFQTSDYGNVDGYKIVKCNSNKNKDSDYLVFLRKNLKFNEEPASNKV